jgi:hypothetical protein
VAVAALDHDRVFVFLRHHKAHLKKQITHCNSKSECDLVGTLECGDESIVRQGIQLLHFLSLHICGAVLAIEVEHASSADLGANKLRRDFDGVENYCLIRSNPKRRNKQHVDEHW